MVSEDKTVKSRGCIFWNFVFFNVEMRPPNDGFSWSFVAKTFIYIYAVNVDNLLGNSANWQLYNFVVVRLKPFP